MRAWSIASQSGAQDLELVECAFPSITDGQVLVRMTAPGVVPLDSALIHNQNEADFPPAVLPLQPGNQGAGVVEDPGTSNFAKGDRVMFGTFMYGYMRPGSWAEYVATDAADLARIPASVSDGAAAQAVVAYPTAWFALQEAGFAAGKTVLVTGVGGSVGNAAVQLATALGAGNVISTAGSAEKAAKAKAAGFGNIIELWHENMVDGVMRLNGGQSVDIVIDSLGGDVLPQTIKCAGRYGVVMMLGFAAGRKSTFTLADFILQRVRLQGFGAYTSTPEEWRDAWDVFTRLADEGKIKPLSDRSFPFDQAPAALRYIVEARPFGAVSLSL